MSLTRNLPRRGPTSPNRGALRGLPITAAVLALTCLLSLAVGANPLGLAEVWRALWAPDASEASNIVWSLRRPRTVIGLWTGAAFGVAGALIQALTRNPLADPGILGVNAGAGFAVTLGIGAFGAGAVSGYVWFAFAGAAAATVTVHLIGSAGEGGASPATLVLAGVSLGAVLGGVGTFLTLTRAETFRAVHNWGLGAIARTSLSDLHVVGPFLAAGLVLALCLGRSLNSVALGDDLAASLGTDVMAVRALTVVAVTLLAGGATAITGGIAFLGLMVPHIVRRFTGPDQRWIIVYSALTAPVILLLADIVGRVIVRPGEVQAGLLTAVIGAPMLIALVRGKGMSQL